MATKLFTTIDCIKFISTTTNNVRTKEFKFILKYTETRLKMSDLNDTNL